MSVILHFIKYLLNAKVFCVNCRVHVLQCPIFSFLVIIIHTALLNKESLFLLALALIMTGLKTRHEGIQKRFFIQSLVCHSPPKKMKR